MFRAILIALFLAAFGWSRIWGQSRAKALYEAERWAELYKTLKRAHGDDFYRGAAAVTFNQDHRRAESYLRSAIQAAPKSEEAYQAYEWLTHLLIYTGQYRRAVSAMEARWAAFPNKPGREQEREAIAAFRGLPDQVTQRVRPSTLPHEEKSIFIPVSVNGISERFFFDTGAWVSATSESEAKRLGFRFTPTTATVGTMTNRAKLRTAVASTVVLGNVRLANVAFYVFPDEGEPWSGLPSGRKGMLGMPVILAFRTLR